MAQTFLINSFINVRSGALTTRDERTGDYVAGNGTRKSLMDFMCNGEYRINSIIRNADGGVTRELFTIGDSLTHYGTRANITHFKIDMGKVIIVLNNSHTIAINTAVKYVAPAETPVTAGTVSSQHADILALQNRIISDFTREIRLEKTLRKRRETLHEFLKLFFEEWNSTKRTVFVDDNTQQTSTGRRRSLGDIYMICRYYYPNVTLTEVLQELYTKLPRELTNGFRTSKCSQIRKRVWYYEGGVNQVLSTDVDDEYRHRPDWYTARVGS